MYPLILNGMESIDQTNLDRMFFALSELKKNGIYWCIDLLTNRQIKSGDYPEFAGETFYTYSIYMPRSKRKSSFIRRITAFGRTEWQC